MNSAPPPSSFDRNTEFYEENRWQKLKRRVFEEPLIPLGCGLTVWALYEATQSMKKGDHNRTNAMFRRRIYAQGFTILAMLAGSIYWSGDRTKRKEYKDLIATKNAKDRHEAWLRELEARDQEDREFEEKMALRARMVRGRAAEEAGASQEERRAIEQQQAGTMGEIRSVLEECERRREGRIAAAARALWQSRQ
ncbi:Respiratory supercomplex factor 1, mitochondrial [Elasticomyces elasticus]|nr:Respiratory supercomplex factor 1, mitochondrial [Elasticomyces elasticus]